MTEAPYTRSRMRSHMCRDDCGCSKAKCKTCLDLDWNLYPESSQAPPDNRDIFTNVGSIIKAADAGCETCAILKKGIEPFSEKLVEEASDLEDDLQSAYVTIELRRGHALLLSLSGKLKYANNELLWLEFYTHLGCATPWPAFGPAEDIPLTLDLDVCVKFTRKWIENCEKSHIDSCHQNKPRLPKRVLDLGVTGASTTLKLKETKDETGYYTTLSHCWGDPSVGLSTKMENVSDFLLEIPWSLLPKTFQDAILITRSLGIRYLWLDSLCIIQDDRHDWNIESAKMASIYSSSYLTIAGTHAPDGRKGLFSTRYTAGEGQADFPRISTEGIQIATDLSKEGQGCKILVRPGHHLAHEDTCSLELVPEIRSPLLTRAWPLQELLLSTRVLHLHAEEMIWECKGCSACECSFLDPPRLPNESIDGKTHTIHNEDVRLYPERVAAYQSLLEDRNLTLFTQLCGGDRNLGVQKTTWYTVVSQYSKLALTMETDRLIALSGLASAVSKNRNPVDTYLAGMWKEDLAHSLFWTVPWAHKRPITRAPQPSPPTWSWASVHFCGPPPQPNYVNLFWGWENVRALLPDIEFSFRDLKAWCEPENENLFGRVTGGVLTVTGSYVVARASYGYYKDDGGLSVRIILDLRGDKELVVSDVSPMEALSAAELQKNVTCLLMGIDKKADYHHSFYSGHTKTEWNTAMVLKESTKYPGKYERIGLLYNQKDRSWFNDAMEKTFEVV